MGRKKAKYSREFKLEAVKQLESGEYSSAELARRLGVSMTNLSDWRKQVNAKQQDAFPGEGRKSGIAAEIARLRREVELLKEERDILKKAAAYFAKESK
jgi:transposase